MDLQLILMCVDVVQQSVQLIRIVLVQLICVLVPAIQLMDLQLILICVDVVNQSVQLISIAIILCAIIYVIQLKIKQICFFYFKIP